MFGVSASACGAAVCAIGLLFCVASASAAGAFSASAAAVRPDALEITIRAGEVDRGVLQAYVPQPGDWIDQSGQHRWLMRGGSAVGAIAGPAQDLFVPFDTYTGDRLDPGWGQAVSDFAVASPGNPPVSVQAVGVKSKPTDIVRTGTWAFDFPMEHRFVLELDRDLIEGENYFVQLRNHSAPLPLIAYTHEPEANVSPAVHSNHAGFHPHDDLKVAYLSYWAGTLGGFDYPANQPFRIVDEASGLTVFTGSATLKTDSNDVEDLRNRNYNLTDVFVLDFSSLQTPGMYRVVVDGIGSSEPFEIGGSTWLDAHNLALRGLFHHRSGVELGPPFTDYVRPRAFHPDDPGVTIYHANTPLRVPDDSLNSQSAVFDRLEANATTQPVPNAWGGTMDAGDWDRRIQHLYATRQILLLFEMFPLAMSAAGGSIPESGDCVPDAIDEALWNLEFYKRLQEPSGGVRGGIESVDHPRYGETSWTNSLPTYAFAPGPWSSYMYAATAARAAHVLGEELAWAQSSVYQQSAIDAFNWAEQEITTTQWTPTPWWVRDARNLAAVELFRLTQDPAYHTVFEQTTVFTDPNKPTWEFESHDQREAALLYARLDLPGMNTSVKVNARSATIERAFDFAGYTEETGFGWAKNPYQQFGYGNIASAEGAVEIIYGHILATTLNLFQESMTRASLYSLGANPANTPFTTGMGPNAPANPLHTDSRRTNQPAPEGIALYGPLDTQLTSYWGHQLYDQELTPQLTDWPTAEAYFDVFQNPAVNEYTIHQTIASNIFTYGYFAGLRRASCIGDFTFDAQVTPADVIHVVTGLGGDSPAFDLNRDCVLDFFDFLQASALFDSACE